MKCSKWITLLEQPNNNEPVVERCRCRGQSRVDAALVVIAL